MEGLHQRLAEDKLVGLIEQQQDIIVLEHNQTVADALRLLGKHNILSAPVVVSPGLEDIESLTPGESAPHLLGWLDVRDIMGAFLSYLHEHKAKLSPNMLALMQELEKQGPHFASKMLITVLGSDDRGLVYQSDRETSVLTAIRELFLGQREGGKLVHRLALFDAHGDITHIVSHTDVLRFLLKHQEDLGAAAHTSIRALGLVQSAKASQLVVLEPQTPTLLAYENLSAAGVTGAPIISPQGELIANLSISDIRGIQPDHFGVLALPVAEFLAVRHGTCYLGYSQQGSKEAAHPFFAARKHAAHIRETGPDAADEEASAAAASATAAGSDNETGKAAGNGSGVHSPHSHHHHKHHSDLRSPSTADDVPLITCTGEATLLEVLKIMCDNVVHRVYVCEKGATPHEVVGVVTPTDILALVSGVGVWVPGQGASSKRGTGQVDNQGTPVKGHNVHKKPKIDEQELQQQPAKQ